MPGLRFTDLQDRPTECRDVTSVTLDEFPPLVPPFEAALQARMAPWRLDGNPRTTRRFAVDKPCPRRTPEDRRFFLLVSLTTSTLHVVQGRVFGMVQRQAHQWMHVLLPAFLGAWRGLGEAPARSLAALAQRLGVAEADAAAAMPAGPATASAAAPAAPLWPLTGPHGASSVPKTWLHRRAVRVASKSATPCNIAS